MPPPVAASTQNPEQPPQLDPALLISCLELFDAYHAQLTHKPRRTHEETHTLAAVGVLLAYLRADYRAPLAAVARLAAHGEISADLLYALLVPRSVLVTTCRVTGAPRAVQLVHARRLVTPLGTMHELTCESVDADDHPAPASSASGEHQQQQQHVEADEELRRTGRVRRFGRVVSRVVVPPFAGTVRICELDIYPLRFHPDAAALRASLLARGRKWAAYAGVHHLAYEGTAAVCLSGVGGCKQIVRYNVRLVAVSRARVCGCVFCFARVDGGRQVNSRIMIDRASFTRLNPNYDMPKVKNEQRSDQPNARDRLALLRANRGHMEFDEDGQPGEYAPRRAGWEHCIS